MTGDLTKNTKETEVSSGARTTAEPNRLAAAFRYYSGALKRDYLQTVESGKQSWRILHYSRVIDPELARYPIAKSSYVRPKTFERHVRYLAKHCRVITLKELIDAIDAEERIPPYTVVITTDGGWRETYANVFLPLLKFGLPSTCFLATAFIGTDSLFWKEKVALYLTALKRAGAPFPKLGLFEDEFKAKLNKISEDKLITAAKIALCIEYLMQVSLEERVAIFTVLANLCEKAGGLPAEQHFMSWDEVVRMKNSRVNFGSCGHRHVRATELAAEEFRDDVRNSVIEIHNHQLEPSPVFSFPEGIVTNEAREILYQLGMRYCLTQGNVGRIENAINHSTVLDRVTMYEEASNCTELFACRLWGI